MAESGQRRNTRGLGRGYIEDAKPFALEMRSSFNDSGRFDCPRYDLAGRRA